MVAPMDAETGELVRNDLNRLA